MNEHTRRVSHHMVCDYPYCPAPRPIHISLIASSDTVSAISWVTSWMQANYFFLHSPQLISEIPNPSLRESFIPTRSSTASFSESHLSSRTTTSPSAILLRQLIKVRLARTLHQ